MQTEAQKRYGKRRTLATRLRKAGHTHAAAAVENMTVKTDDLLAVK